MSAFTCAACGSFQYQKEQFQLPCGVVCEECWRNNIGSVQISPLNYGIKKPGLHEVLVSIHEAEYSIHCNYSDWIQSNGDDEEAVAEKCQQARPELWKAHYQRITGEPWQ